MGIITRTRAHPAMLRALARYCAYREITESDVASLQRVLAPDAFGAQKAGSVWHDSLLLASELGLVDQDDERVAIRPTLRAELAVDDVGAFRRALRKVVLAPVNNEGLWAVSNGVWPAGASTEFSRIASWFLDQPFELDHPEISARARPQLKTTLRLIENPDQGRVFERWCVALGLGATLFDNLLPDPIKAVSEELPDIYQDSEELPALTVRDQLLERLPVLTGGAYAAGLDQVLKVVPRRVPHAAGPSLTRSLQGLERRGVIAFVSRSDAESMTLEDSDRAGPTHLRLVKR
jgi:hypothetical protein